MHKFIRQGEWATNQGVAECIEQEGFGIVGAIIDKTGEGYLMQYLLAAPNMRKALESTLSWMTNVNVNDPATLGRQIMAALEESGVPKDELDAAAVCLVRGPCAVPNLMNDDPDELIEAAEDDIGLAAQAASFQIMEELSPALDMSHELFAACEPIAKLFEDCKAGHASGKGHGAASWQ